MFTVLPKKSIENSNKTAFKMMSIIKIIFFGFFWSAGERSYY